MNLKTILVNLPLSNEESAGSFKQVANILPPLGLGYIAAVLEQNKFEVKIIDCRPINISLSQLIARLKEEKPQIIGIMATVLDIQRAIEAAKRLKKELPEAWLVLGGPHLTSTPLATMENSLFDIGVIGEGEFTMLELVNQVKSGKLDLEKIKGIIYKDQEQIKITAPRPYLEDIELLPFPARHLFPPLDQYSPILASYIKTPLAHLITSRGCPYQCIFCDRKIFGNVFRARSAKSVVDEIEELINRHGAKEIKFFDDTFTFDKARVYAIIDEIHKRNLKFPWSCLTRVNHVDKPLLEAMKKSGCWQVLYGLESGDQRILNIMKKGITLEQSRNAVVWAKAAGLNIRGSFVIGVPGETMESINRTINFAKSLPLDSANFYALTLYPGNELYELAKKEGTIFHEDYSQYNPIIDTHTTSLAYVPAGLTEKQLKAEIVRAHKEFYLRPSYILRQIAAIRRPSDLLRYWKGFRVIVGL